jgi:hypothetical protein
MREKLKGKKSYLFAGFAVALAAWGVISGELTTIEGVTYLLGGGALAAVRGAIG